MRIKSIKFNKELVDTMWMGQKTGSATRYTEAVVGKYLDSLRVAGITEVTPTVYDIELVEHWNSKRSWLRVFNPFEVSYEEEKEWEHE